MFPEVASGFADVIPQRRVSARGERRNGVKALDQRIAMRYHMPPLSSEESKTYINHQLKLAGAKDPILDDKALEAVHEVSFGIPRKIGVITEQALTYAMFDQKRTVTPEVVLKVKRLQE